MDYSKEAERKAKTKLNRFVFLPSVFLLSAVFWWQSGKPIDIERIVGMLLLSAFVLFMPYVILRLFLVDGVARRCERQLVQQYHQQQAAAENARYHRDFNRDMERKRRELEIEFEHYKKIALLNAANDHAKIRLINELERQFYQQQNDDLNSLNTQIERMKREL